MKRFTAILLALALCLPMRASVFAEDDANSAEDTFRITSIEVISDGSLKVTWEDPFENGPYQVLFEPVTDASQNAPSGEQIVWCNSGAVEGNTYTEKYVVPDSAWWFILQDAFGHQTSCRFDPSEKAIVKSGFTVKAETYLRKSAKEYVKTNGDILDGHQFHMKDLNKAAEEDTYGLVISIAREEGPYGSAELKYSVECKGGTGLNDSPMVLGTFDAYIGEKIDSTSSFFLSLTPYFRQMQEKYGSLTGFWLLVLYDGNDRIAEIPFSVTY